MRYIQIIIISFYLLTFAKFGQTEETGIVFHREVNGKYGWNENGNEEKDGKYVGEIEKGKPNGQGIYTSPNGNKYEGEWKNGKINGQGTYTYSKGKKYVGEWKDEKRHGQGIYTYTKGNK